MKAPYPYFGGKSTISSLVWSALGQPRHYMEPFFGSGAVLLNRPNYDPTKHIETVCDSNGFLCNVWRSLQFSPEETARWCDWPVNHADLSARKRKLLENKDRLLEGLIADDQWCDALLAGYWIWAASCWIGSGLTSINSIPDLGDSGMGVHSIGQRPHLSDAGKGVHKISLRPHLSDAGKGVQEPYNTNIYVWFRQLSERLRHVRVVCGDWSRICGGNWQDKTGDVGIFFDPPYGVSDRGDVYGADDSKELAAKVQAWALERGQNPNYRIVICGYEEHEELLNHGWISKKWKSGGGYGNISDKNTRGKQNRRRECLYFSPHSFRTELDLEL